MSKLEDVSVSYRNQEVAKNRYNYNKPYTIGNPDELSPIGKDENNGQVGDTNDIKARKTLLAKNKYNAKKGYDSHND